MANDIEREILDRLLDAYENSRTFLNKNKVRQSFRISPSRLFPKYDDDSEFEFYKEVNTSVASLEERGLISCKTEGSGKVTAICLAPESIPQAYRYLGRSSRSDMHRQLLRALDEFEDQCDCNHSVYAPLLGHIHEQRGRISENKGLLFLGDDLMEYTNLLTAVMTILGNTEELFVRELSVQLFKDSKKLESMESKIRSFLHRYGEYDSRETALEEHNIVKAPTYVFVKGTGVLDCGQRIDLGEITGDIGLSTQTLKSLRWVDLKGAGVITIENLTSFHKYNAQKELVVYLGGFHNRAKRDFIRLVGSCNPNTQFRHFGDIDAGGFYILEHLKAKTGMQFIPYNMDKKTLEENSRNWRPLTENDRTRLKLLSEKTTAYDEVIGFMLQNDCKLEQEAEL